MFGLRFARPDTFEKGNNRGGTTSQRSEHVTGFLKDRCRAGEILRRQMVHQSQKKRQVFDICAFLIERQDIAACFCMEQIVGVLNALRNAFEGEKTTNVIEFEKR